MSKDDLLFLTLIFPGTLQVFFFVLHIRRIFYPDLTTLGCSGLQIGQIAC